MRLIDADAVTEALRNRIGEDIDECINNVPTVDVLDKIRKEIQGNINYNKKMNYQGIVAGLLLTLDIIDKYQTLDSIDKYRKGQTNETDN